MITQRIRQIMEAYGLNARSFADRVGVQRSGMSHLFNGRNKPSLDLILKIIKRFPAVPVQWLLFGEGELNIKEDTNVNSSESNKSKYNDDVHIPEFIEPQEKVSSGRGIESDSMDILEATSLVNNPDLDEQTSDSMPNDFKLIVLFYKDGTFESYKNRK